ncbi:MAG: hypothetical protein PHG24_01065 [Candidatus Pacebacteria bacterium]|nr:hypothetical protein [Candidatus Paceibacterota bacterium]
MKILNADQKRNIEINNLLQKIKYNFITKKTKTPIFIEFYVNGSMEHKTILLLNTLKEMGGIDFNERNWDEINETLEKNRNQTKKTIAEGYWVEPIEPKFSQLCKEYEKKIEGKSVKEIKNMHPVPNKYEVYVKDREIWVNNYLIGKPHATGSNFEFFDYIRSQEPHKKIERRELPSKLGDLSLKKQIEKKSFIKILNGLGFKGEILKAFFDKRGKDTITYAGDKISKEYLEKKGIKINILLKELDLANDKNTR